jgi:hypothetical protein
MTGKQRWRWIGRSETIHAFGLLNMRRSESQFASGPANNISTASTTKDDGQQKMNGFTYRLTSDPPEIQANAHPFDSAYIKQTPTEMLARRPAKAFPCHKPNAETDGPSDQ